MATMTSQQRADCHAEFMRAIPAGQTYSITKAQLLAALNAMDDWIDANAASLNTAIPQPARASLTAAQKAQLFSAVVANRYKLGV